MTADQEHENNHVTDTAGADGTTEANIALFRRFYERAWNDGDLSVLDEALAPAFVNHSLPPGVPDHREAYRRAIVENRRMFPDFALTWENITAVGDLVAARWRFRAHAGEEAPPDVARGIAFEGEGLTVVRIVDGRITEFWKDADAEPVLAAAQVDPEIR